MTDTQQKFFDRINKLGTGERASLRREAGIMIRDADAAALRTFYSCLPSSVNTNQEGMWFAVACLRCLWDPSEVNGTPIEQIISSLLAKDELSESTKHRVELLLDTKWGDDGYMLTKLSRLIKLVRQKSGTAAVDFASLLDDVIYWNASSQTVQRKWARAIYTNAKNEEGTE